MHACRYSGLTSCPLVELRIYLFRQDHSVTLEILLGCLASEVPESTFSIQPPPPPQHTHTHSVYQRVVLLPAQTGVTWSEGVTKHMY